MLYDIPEKHTFFLKDQFCVQIDFLALDSLPPQL